ncbi:GIY-YIG nuclease family protein [Burkholderia pseudomultivorans]|uniref:GIY-YIG nuclease family protein n=1 Tax=Burkholderia pseudomultivorans TaxID=1207504 RepID=UPI0028770F26|nr:GIY-YIG nuclease family protein [Burkholderia pseudomultivorans]MDS0794387.1 GIY-YIG nuclease family protein [Burkholderia pseudomultivorans]
MRPFSLRIFVPSGDPTGILIATRDDGIGKATLFSRHLLGEVKGRKDWSFPGVYLLVGQSKLYIGEGDPVGKRLEEHATKKEFWNRALFFTAENRLNKAHIQHLESRLIKLAIKAGVATLDNGNQPQPPALGEEEYAFAENVLADMLLTLPLLGHGHFESAAPVLDDDDGTEPHDDSIAPSTPKGAAVYSQLPRDSLFRCNYKEARATIELVEGGVEVKSGSTIVREPAPSFDVWRPGYAQLRRQLIESGVVAEKNGQMIFVRDQFFTSASAAASIVCGVSSNADIWNSESNQSLGDLLRAAKQKQA